MDVLQNVKESIRSLTGYVSPPQQELHAKLNQNENPFDVPIAVKRELAEAMVDLHWNRYPRYIPSELRAKLSEWISVQPECILVGNGSNQLFQTCVSTVLKPHDKVLYSPPTFSLYEIFARVYEADLLPVPMTDDFDFPCDEILSVCTRENPRLVVICSPNNPTGGEIDIDFVEQLCSKTSGLVFWDEAYAEFSDQSALTLLPTCENLVVSRTFSKAASMAGLRLGYLVAHPRLIDEFYKVYLPYSINIFTEIVATTLLNNPGWIAQNVTYLVQEREWLYRELQSIPQIRVYPSRANFFLLRVPEAEKAIRYLQDRGITVRNIGSGSQQLHNHFRVSVSTHQENRLFIDSMQGYIQSLVPSDYRNSR